MSWPAPSPETQASGPAGGGAAPDGARSRTPRGARDGTRGGAPRAPARAPAHTATRTVLRVLDRWRYDGRWWELEIHREYYLLELQGGSTLELFREEDTWWAARVSD